MAAPVCAQNQRQIKLDFKSDYKRESNHSASNAGTSAAASRILSNSESLYSSRSLSNADLIHQVSNLRPVPANALSQEVTDPQLFCSYFKSDSLQEDDISKLSASFTKENIADLYKILNNHRMLSDLPFCDFFGLEFQRIITDPFPPPKNSKKITPQQATEQNTLNELLTEWRFTFMQGYIDLVANSNLRTAGFVKLLKVPGFSYQDKLNKFSRNFKAKLNELSSSRKSLINKPSQEKYNKIDEEIQGYIDAWDQAQNLFAIFLSQKKAAMFLCYPLVSLFPGTQGLNCECEEDVPTAQKTAQNYLSLITEGLKSLNFPTKNFPNPFLTVFSNMLNRFLNLRPNNMARESIEMLREPQFFLSKCQKKALSLNQWEVAQNVCLSNFLRNITLGLERAVAIPLNNSNKPSQAYFLRILLTIGTSKNLLESTTDQSSLEKTSLEKELDNLFQDFQKIYTNHLKSIYNALLDRSRLTPLDYFRTPQITQISQILNSFLKNCTKKLENLAPQFKENADRNSFGIKTGWLALLYVLSHDLSVMKNPKNADPENMFPDVYIKLVSEEDEQPIEMVPEEDSSVTTSVTEPLSAPIAPSVVVEVSSPITATPKEDLTPEPSLPAPDVIKPNASSLPLQELAVGAVLKTNAAASVILPEKPAKKRDQTTLEDALKSSRKLRQVEGILKRFGLQPIPSGNGSHQKFRDPQTGAIVVVPGHEEIAVGTRKSIAKQVQAVQESRNQKKANPHPDSKPTKKKKS